MTQWQLCCISRCGNTYHLIVLSVHNLLSNKCDQNNLHRPGIEPGPPAWQASILPLNHRCEQFYLEVGIQVSTLSPNENFWVGLAPHVKCIFDVISVWMNIDLWPGGISGIFCSNPPPPPPPPPQTRAHNWVGGRGRGVLALLALIYDIFRISEFQVSVTWACRLNPSTEYFEAKNPTIPNRSMGCRPLSNTVCFRL